MRMNELINLYRIDILKKCVDFEVQNRHKKTPAVAGVSKFLARPTALRADCSGSEKLPSPDHSAPALPD
jgi:hypothetical protein